MEQLKSSFGASQSVIEIGAFFQPKSDYAANDADNVLNRIATHLCNTDGFDQSGLHGNQKDRYQFTLGLRGEDGSFLTQSFYLKDYVLGGALDNDWDFCTFMESLDRDKLGEAMRLSLIDIFHLSEQTMKTDKGNVIVTAPQFWRRDLRQCCHPHYAHRIEQRLMQDPALAA